MNDILVLRSAIDLMDSETQIRWHNKHMLPPGYNWNADGYVITLIPFPYLRACVGWRFAYLIGRLGLVEFIRQNLIVLRLLNGGVHKSIVTACLFYACKKAGFIVDRDGFDKIADEVYALESVPPLDGNFITWRRTWFSETCEYDTVSKVLKLENTSKIDADRELMRIDEKYITDAVAKFTGFSKHRIDNYWSEKEWSKKLRSLYTLEEAMDELNKNGITNPTRQQLADISGLSLRTITTVVKDFKELLNMRADTKALNEHNVNEKPR